MGDVIDFHSRKSNGPTIEENLAILVERQSSIQGLAVATIEKDENGEDKAVLKVGLATLNAFQLLALQGALVALQAVITDMLTACDE